MLFLSTPTTGRTESNLLDRPWRDAHTGRNRKMKNTKINKTRRHYARYDELVYINDNRRTKRKSINPRQTLNSILKNLSGRSNIKN